jgi:hypothetical protein
LFGKIFNIHTIDNRNKVSKTMVTSPNVESSANNVTQDKTMNGSASQSYMQKINQNPVIQNVASQKAFKKPMTLADKMTQHLTKENTL